MNLACACLLTVVLGGGSLCAQTSTTEAAGQPGKAVVAGTVSKDPGSEPVKKAVIELIAERPNEGGNYTALTGPDGGFLIENILPGHYRLFVERPGYQEVNKRHRRMEGRTLTLMAGQELKDLVIHLQAAAVVAGRVTDEDGDPMADAQVAVMRQTFEAGRSRWEQAGAERTNDLGEYRIGGLAVGSYFVSVVPPPDFLSVIQAANTATSDMGKNGTAPPDKVATAYQTTYYPGTRDRAQAEPIQLHAGDDFPMNFSLTPSPSLTIRGVVNLPPGASAAIMLLSREFNLLLNGTEMHKDGSFEIRDVSPGFYTIMANVDNAGAPMRARQTVQVGSANVEGVRLAPQAGGSIRGRVRMEGGGNIGVPADLSQMFLELLPAEGDDGALRMFAVGDGFSPGARVQADGSFEWKDVPPGHYSVQIADAIVLPDWFLKSVVAGGRDAAESGINVGGGTTTLDVIASGNGAAVAGAASNEKDGAVADAVVVAVPETRLRSHPERYRKTVTDQRGRFTLRGLPPGDYTLFAWESVDGEAYCNPEFLKEYEGQGKALHVNEGDHTSIQLNAIPAAEDRK